MPIISNIGIDLPSILITGGTLSIGMKLQGDSQSSIHGTHFQRLNPNNLSKLKNLSKSGEWCMFEEIIYRTLCSLPKTLLKITKT